MTTAAMTDQFDIGRVASRAFDLIARNIVLLGALALLLYGLPKLGASMLEAATDNMPGFPGAVFSMTGGVYGLLALLGYVALQAAVVHVCVSDMNGRRAQLPDSLRAALTNYGALFGVVILSFLGILLGTLALVVPGLMLATAWAVAVPAAAIERTGVQASFARSAWLTRGHRWSILAIIAVFIVAQWIVRGAVHGLQGGMLDVMHVMDPISDLAQGLTGDLFETLFALIGSVMVVSTYYELRMIKEEIGPADLDDQIA